jgi:hypothetical protein
MGTLSVSMVRFGRTSITLTGDYTLTAAEQATRTLKFTGSGLGGAVTVTLDSVLDGQEWIVWNDCGFALTLKASGGTGIVVADERTAILRCDDTDVRRVTADTTITT